MILRRFLNTMSTSILKTTPLGPGPMPTLDPFLFCVYHKDQYPPGNPDMEAPFPGNGSDFNDQVPYRMYHGSSIPGFPQHPHRGFETITATMEGIIDHADSLGNAGRYGKGDVQWMTAGKGVVHSEMFPLIEQQRDNPTRFFQIWLNLPARSKMVDPGFAMFWAHEVPHVDYDDAEDSNNNEKVSVTVWSGTNYLGVTQNNAPPPDSWAADLEHDVCVWHITLQPGGRLELPVAHKGSDVNRSLFYIEGGARQMKVDGQAIDSRVVLQVKPDVAITLEMSAEADGPGEFLMLQGVPIGEPVAQHGPFVMNTAGEINQAFMDYQRTKFGGWPWPRDDMVFPREKNRFAKLNGEEVEPPAQDDTCSSK